MDLKNDLTSNSYFVKIKTFRLQTSKLLGNRRRTYIYQWSVPVKKHAGWLRKCLFKYSTEVRFVLEILENSKVIASELSQKWITPFGNPLGQNRRPLNYVVFLLITLVDSVPFLIHLRNYTCFNFHLQSIPCLQTYSLVFFLK